MTYTRLRPTFTLTEDRLTELQAVIPEVFADGKINWNALRDILDPFQEEDGADTEHYGLIWPGKRNARRFAAQPSVGCLRPSPGEGVNEDSTRNVFIEGDNLEVLKLLLKSYAGRIKMIYIDPPYNTGSDFVYKDNYREPLEDYLRKTGQSDEEGKMLTTNTKADGRFHSNWLSMMYPRLLLARQFLRDDGILLVSIDDGEVANPKLALNEVFGEENFIAHILWQKRYVSNVTAQFLSDMHDHILVYARQKEAVRVNKLPRTEEQLKDYRNPDSDPRGPWRAQDLSASKPYSAGLFTITTPAGIQVDPPPGRYWRCNQAQYEEWVSDNRIWFGMNGTARPMLKAFLSEVQEGLTPNTWWSYDFAGHNKEATLEVKALFEGSSPFDTAKPVKLIHRMLELFTKPDSLVLDFFAGSCTTAHAILELNREEGGSRQFICVQLPEVTPLDSEARRAGFSTIAEIGKERIRRVIQRMSRDNTQLSLVNESNVPEDLGFKVFKLGQSNFRAWQDFTGDRVSDLEGLFDRIETPLVDGWTEPDLLTEVMLLQGYPLASSLELQPTFRDNRIVKVDPDDGSHALFVCLDPEIADSTIQELLLNPEDTFVCLDSALSDEAKLRLADVCNLQTI